VPLTTRQANTARRGHLAAGTVVALSPDMPNASPFLQEALPCLPEILRAARRFAGPRGDVADDLVQETFLRALCAADRYQPGTNARAWLHAILKNAARSSYRRDRRDSQLRERYARDPTIAREAPAPTARATVRDRAALAPPGRPAVAAAGPRRSGLRELVVELPPDFRVVVDLVDLQGLSYREAAARLGCPVGTVMSRLHRGRRRLRRRFDEGLAAAPSPGRLF
jgi:RNA polymerase sigma-70 factor (ECF subfamily)